jgi:hypothetical protein
MKVFTTLTLLAFLLFSVSANAERPEGEGDEKGFAKTAEDEFQVDFISINNCLMWIATNGMTAHNPLTDASGFEWPKGSAKNAIFTDGIIWGGTIQGEVRVGGATYRYGLKPGKIHDDGSPADPTDPRYRIYKVRKISEEDYNNPDILTTEQQDRLRRDFTEWPVDDGAPYTDVNGNNKYDPNFDDFLVNGDTATTDTPWFIGDEVIWFVSNDLDSRATNFLYGTPPIGFELHTLVWSYNQTGPLANIVFTKYKLINKGDDDYRNAYLSKWSDPDLGDAFDDYVGIDTTLSLGYVYNGIAKDEVYNVPPAAGYDFFQGPIVPTETLDTIAHFNFGLKQGYKNLPVSTFAFYINGDFTYRDPSLGSAFGALMMYRYQQGLNWNGNSYVDPTTQLVVPITLAGDPITRQGWIDGLIHAPGDRRFLMTAGPFDINEGDTQEVVVSTIVGLGGDRLSSINVLKFYDRFAQLAFDNNFDLPQAPPSPTVKASLQRKEILLHWGDPAQVNYIENFEDKNYKFQGYNVYQFPAASATLAEGKRIATFDLDDGKGTILDVKIDQNSGIPVSLPVQFGTDSGMEHLIRITSDALADKPLVNNQPYYFAVTSYSWNDDVDAFPTQLESSPRIIELRPQTTDPGIRYGVPYNESIEVKHTQGVSTGIIDVIAIDPLLLTGDTYEISFKSVGKVESRYNADFSDEGGGLAGNWDSLVVEETLILDDASSWSLTNLTVEGGPKVVVDDSRNLDGLDKDYFVVDGFQLGVRGSGYYQQFTDTIHKPDEYYISNEILEVDWFGGPEFYEPHVGGSPPTTYSWLPGYWSNLFSGPEGLFGSSITGYNVNKIVEIRLDRTKPSKGYVYHRPSSGNYRFGGHFETPVSVWDVTDPDNEKQLTYVWVENPGRPTTFDDTWAPSTAALDREDFYVLDIPYSDTPEPEYTSPSFNFGVEAANLPILYFGAYKLISSQLNLRYPWSDGSGWKITPNVAFTPADRYQFTTMAPIYTVENAVQDINQINVFPNPYLGANDQELNKYQRFVTFNHLPSQGKVEFRIYTLSGTLVRSFSKPNDGSQYAEWDLQNDNALPVGSGMYLIHIDMPDIGVEKVLKLGVVAETQYLDRI